MSPSAAGMPGRIAECDVDDTAAAGCMLAYAGSSRGGGQEAARVPPAVYRIEEVQEQVAEAVAGVVVLSAVEAAQWAVGVEQRLASVEAEAVVVVMASVAAEAGQGAMARSSSTSPRTRPPRTAAERACPSRSRRAGLRSRGSHRAGGAVSRMVYE